MVLVVLAGSQGLLTNSRPPLSAGPKVVRLASVVVDRPTVTQFLSLRAYAKSRGDRGLPGHTHRAVKKAIDDGRLVRAVRKGSKGQPLIDAETADREWAGKTDPAQQREPGPAHEPRQTGLFGELDEPRVGDAPSDGASAQLGREIRTSQAKRLHFRARLEELNYRNRAGELVERAVVEREHAQLAREIVQQLEAVPDRICSHCAATTDSHRVKMIIQGAIHQALRSLIDIGQQRKKGKR